jgi:hypothetical protein
LGRALPVAELRFKLGHLGLSGVQGLIRQDRVLHQNIGGVGIGFDRLVDQAGRFGILQTAAGLNQVLEKAA